LLPKTPKPQFIWFKIIKKNNMEQNINNLEDEQLTLI